MSRKAKQNRIESFERISARLKRLHATFEAESLSVSECIAVSECDCQFARDSRDFDAMLAAAEVEFDEEGEEPVDDDEDGPEEQGAPPTENSPLTQRTLLVALGKALSQASAAAAAESIHRRRR